MLSPQGKHSSAPQIYIVQQMIRLQWSWSDGWLEVLKNGEIIQLTFDVTIVFEDNCRTLRSPWTLHSSPTWIASGSIAAATRHVCGRSRLQKRQGEWLNGSFETVWVAHSPRAAGTSPIDGCGSWIWGWSIRPNGMMPGMGLWAQG